METISIVSSVVSVIIGLFAIWLSVTFYRMSSAITVETKDAAKDMGAAVDRLEKLFDHLYSDTFAMMKDTVSDMRRHIWPEHKGEQDIDAIVDRKSAEKIKGLKDEVSRELEDLVRRVSHTDERIAEVRDDIDGVLNRMISESRKVEREAKTETVRDAVLQHLRQLLRRKRRGYIEAVEFIEGLTVPVDEALKEVHSMAEHGITTLDPMPDSWHRIGPDTQISLRA